MFPEMILKTRCIFDEYDLCVLRELDGVFNQRGILGYRQEWPSYTFPIDGFQLNYAYLKFMR